MAAIGLAVKYSTLLVLLHLRLAILAPIVTDGESAVKVAQSSSDQVKVAVSSENVSEKAQGSVKDTKPPGPYIFRGRMATRRPKRPPPRPPLEVFPTDGYVLSFQESTVPYTIVPRWFHVVMDAFFRAPRPKSAGGNRALEEIRNTFRNIGQAFLQGSRVIAKALGDLFTERRDDNHPPRPPQRIYLSLIQ